MPIVANNFFEPGFFIPVFLTIALLILKKISYRQCLMIIFAIFLVVPSMIFGIGEWTYFYYFFPPIGFLGIIVLAILGIDKSKSKRMAFVIFGVLLLILLAAFIMYLLDEIIYWRRSRRIPFKRKT